MVSYKLVNIQLILNLFSAHRLIQLSAPNVKLEPHLECFLYNTYVNPCPCPKIPDVISSLPRSSKTTFKLPANATTSTITTAKSHCGIRRMRLHYCDHGISLSSHPALTNTNPPLQDLITAPLRIASSKRARKTYLNTLLFILTSALLFLLAVAAYVLFYLNYVPQIGVERVVWLQYGYVVVTPPLNLSLPFLSSPT
jgi:hypothetical protein